MIPGIWNETEGTLACCPVAAEAIPPSFELHQKENASGGPV